MIFVICFLERWRLAVLTPDSEANTWKQRDSDIGTSCKSSGFITPVPEQQRAEIRQLRGLNR